MVVDVGSNEKNNTPPGAGGNGGGGPVNRFAWLVEKAIECGLDPAQELRSLLEKWLVSIDQAVCAGDVEGVLEPLENLADLAAFVRMMSPDLVSVAASASEAERTRFLTLLHAREHSLKEWAARAKRLANLVLKLQHDPAYWPGPGAMYGSPRWQIAHDSLEVISRLALPLASVAEGDGNSPVPDDPIAMAAATMLDPLAVARAAKEARNVLRGGRRDTSRGTDLRHTCNTIRAGLLLGEHLDNQGLAAWLVSVLAESFGAAFRETSVLAECTASLRRNRAKGAVPTIAADVVLSARRVADASGAPSECFRFPIGQDFDARVRAATKTAGKRNKPGSRVRVSAHRLLMQDFAKAFLARAKGGSVH